MNRHGKFYAELEAELNNDDDDDYYDEDDEDDAYNDEEDDGVGAYDDDDANTTTTATTTVATANTKATTTTSTKAATTTADSSSDKASRSAGASSVRVDVSASVARGSGGGRTLKVGGGGGGTTTATTTTALHVASAAASPATMTATTTTTTTTAEANASSPLTSALTTITTTVADTTTTTSAPSREARASGGAAAATTTATRKPQCTLVIAGHVDAGKSTTLGHLLLLLGRVSAAEVERNEREGRQSHKESFKYAWLLDQSEEERRRGVTIDAGSFVFDTPHRRVHVLDAPGHKEFVLSMISSATLADAALLVVTAAPSEFESGLAHGTREHLLVLKTLGVGSIVVAVNKMDVVGFAHDRYAHVVRELQQLMRQMRIKETIVTGYCPVSGMTGANLVTRDAAAMPWYEGATLLQLLDSCPLESRLVHGSLRVSVQDVQGSTLYGKIESGTLRRGDTLVCVPGNVKLPVRRLDLPTVVASASNSNNNSNNNNNSNGGGGNVAVAVAGDTVEVTAPTTIVGVTPGCVACSVAQPLLVSTDVEAHVQTFATLTRSILPGATFTMAVHALTVPVKVVALVSLRSGKTGEWSRGMVKAVPPSTQAIVLLRADSAIAVEAADVCRALGRFVLRQDGETVAGGLVKRVVPVTPHTTG